MSTAENVSHWLSRRPRCHSRAFLAVASAAALSLSCGSGSDAADERNASAATTTERNDDGSAAPATGAPGNAASLPGTGAPGGAGEPSADGRVDVDEGAVDPSGVMGVGASGTDDVGGTGSGGTTPARPLFDFGATVENTGADCEVPELAGPAELPRIDRLPDPFTQLDGTRLAQTSEWRCRRQEILEQAEKYIYGEKPPKPESVAGSVTSDTVTVQIQHEGKSIQFSAEIVLPPGTGPFPALINLGARSGFGGITLGEQVILGQGVAIIFYNHYDLGQEGQPEASRGLPNPGLFYDIYGGDHSAGLLMAWAWGASRLMDVLQESGSGVIDPNRVGVTGCSRNGKGAFAVGVFDERIALTKRILAGLGYIKQ